ncbi:hypothetical protein D1BOALGB6SA_8188 [Olavius sp. associated proteobacterium Delta 1]|nr:hypothetical protein D1BOALGB6SA_8188 [Olavius sp. associated proteobacterium Delta 1]
MATAAILFGDDNFPFCFFLDNFFLRLRTNPPVLSAHLLTGL